MAEDNKQNNEDIKSGSEGDLLAEERDVAAASLGEALRISFNVLKLIMLVLVVLTVLERQQELTALKAAGLSLYRLVVPVLLIAGVCAGLAR